MCEAETFTIDDKDPEIQKELLKFGAEKADSLVIQILCRRVMRLEDSVNQLIDALNEIGIITVEEEKNEEECND